MVKDLSINLANQQARQQRRDVQKFSANPSYDRGPRRCFQCGEEGHIAAYCRSETRRPPAAPSNATKAKESTFNLITIEEPQIGDTTETYAATTDKAKGRAVPYPNRRPVGRPRKTPEPSAGPSRTTSTTMEEVTDNEEMLDED